MKDEPRHRYFCAHFLCYRGRHNAPTRAAGQPGLVLTVEAGGPACGTGVGASRSLRPLPTLPFRDSVIHHSLSGHPGRAVTRHLPTPAPPRRIAACLAQDGGAHTVAALLPRGGVIWRPAAGPATGNAARPRAAAAGPRSQGAAGGAVRARPLPGGVPGAGRGRAAGSAAGAGPPARRRLLRFRPDGGLAARRAPAGRHGAAALPARRTHRPGCGGRRDGAAGRPQRPRTRAGAAGGREGAGPRAGAARGAGAAAGEPPRAVLGGGRRAAPGPGGAPGQRVVAGPRAAARLPMRRRRPPPHGHVAKPAGLPSAAAQRRGHESGRVPVPRPAGLRLLAPPPAPRLPRAAGRRRPDGQHHVRIRARHQVRGAGLRWTVAVLGGLRVVRVGGRAGGIPGWIRNSAASGSGEVIVPLYPALWDRISSAVFSSGSFSARKRLVPWSVCTKGQ